MNTKIDEILNDYCRDEMKKLKKLCYPMIIKIGGISEKDHDDFYSIALDALYDSVLRFEENKDCQFNTFLSGNIKRKFMTEIRDRNRGKRIPAKQIESFSVFITEDGYELGEIIPSDFDVHEEAFGNNFDGTKIERYLERLTHKQREIVSLLCKGYRAKEIREMLHMSYKDYQNNLAAIQAYENVRILM